jgi:hypothetical protein
MQELSQNQLANSPEFLKNTISAIVNDGVRLGVERSKALAKALKCHPGLLVFPGWEMADEVAA